MVDIPDYATLQTRIAEYIDDTTQTAKITGWIERAERTWDRTLWIPSREVVSTATGVTERLALPADYRVVRALSAAGVGPLRQTNPMETFIESTAGAPGTYSLQRGEIVFEPALAASTVITLLYYQTLPFLSVSVTSNWLLAAHPDLYLAGCLTQAYAFLLDNDEAAKWQGEHDRILFEIKDLARMQRYGGGPLIATVA